jgi:hypothetical protein
MPGNVHPASIGSGFLPENGVHLDERDLHGAAPYIPDGVLDLGRVVDDHNPEQELVEISLAGRVVPVGEDADLIRANQGHSAPVDLQLEERGPPEVLDHGTVERFLPAILAEGLIKGRRHHVHFSKEVVTAPKVGARRGKPVVLVVDAGGMYRDGYKFFLSANGVWLTDAVPPDYLGRE